MLIVYTPLYSTEHEAEGSNCFAAGVGSVKHPVFLGRDIIDILQTLRNPELFIPSSARFSTVIHSSHMHLYICTEMKQHV